MNEWKEITLGEVCNFKRGYDLSKNKMINGIYPVAGSNGVIGYHNEFTAIAPSITIGRSGNIGNPYFYNENIWSHNTILYVNDYKNTFPNFLYYLLKTLNLKHYSGGSAVPTLNRNHIHNIMVLVPTKYETQQKIAKILSCLDKKIELNNKINANLEEQAQAIFKSWFVNFEPFGGVMPSYWEVKTLGEVCESVSNKHNFENEKLVFLNTGDVTKGVYHHKNFMSVSQMPGQAKKSIKENDILYSEIRPINNHFAYVNFDADDYVVSTKFMVIRAKEINSRRLYHYLTSNKVVNILQNDAVSRSGTFPQIRFENIQNIDIIIADDETEKTFNNMLVNYYSIIDSNQQENEKLTQLRDTLLPKLMNGEIDVDKVVV